MIEKKVIDQIIPQPSPGSFSVTNPIRFDHCRERFAGIFNESLSEFYYSHKNSFEKLFEFIEKTEIIIGLVEKSRIIKTNYENIVLVQPSCFWRCCSLRRNLFTVFLRVGMVYEGNYQEALLKENYSKQSINGIYRFLYGFTEYIGPPISPTYDQTSTITCGWVRLFNEKDPEYVKKMLVKNSKDYSWEIEKALWA